MLKYSVPVLGQKLFNDIDIIRRLSDNHELRQRFRPRSFTRATCDHLNSTRYGFGGWCGERRSLRAALKVLAPGKQ